MQKKKSETSRQQFLIFWITLLEYKSTVALPKMLTS